MSGGHFNYSQFSITQIADDIECIIATNTITDEWGVCRNYPPDIIENMKETVELLRALSVRVRHIDYLLSGDYGIDTFRNQWSKDCNE